MVKKMEKAKIIMMMVNYLLKENFDMIKSMGKEKNIIIMVN